MAAVEPEVVNPANSQFTRPRYEYGYDALGNQTIIRDPLGRETTFSFDGHGNQLTRTLPSGLTASFTYDLRGRMILHVSFEDRVTEYVYANCGCTAKGGRIESKRYFPTSAAYAAGTPAETVTYKYDAFGRQVEIKKLLDGNPQPVELTTTSYDPEAAWRRSPRSKGRSTTRTTRCAARWARQRLAPRACRPAK